jgi:protein-tyrosine-phosphatase
MASETASLQPDRPEAPGEPLPQKVELLTVCTGNAARSVMAGFMLGYLAEVNGLPVHIVTAGTHTIDGQPMSMRTRTALQAIPELEDLSYGRHRSRQLNDADAHRADLIIAMEGDHLRYIRRHHPVEASRTSTLRHLAEHLPSGTDPLRDRVARMELDRVVIDDDEDVIDPAGHEQDFYTGCAKEIWRLCLLLVPRL